MLIYCLDGTVKAPSPGLYAIRFGTKLRERALGVRHAKGLWTVYLDGREIAPSNERWPLAFGSIFAKCQPLVGRQLADNDYKYLIAERTRDIFNGIDLAKPMKVSQEKAAI